jgi:hypothetical protein
MPYKLIHIPANLAMRPTDSDVEPLFPYPDFTPKMQAGGELIME